MNAGGVGEHHHDRLQQQLDEVKKILVRRRRLGQSNNRKNVAIRLTLAANPDKVGVGVDPQ